MALFTQFSIKAFLNIRSTKIEGFRIMFTYVPTSRKNSPGTPTPGARGGGEPRKKATPQAARQSGAGPGSSPTRDGNQIWVTGPAREIKEISVSGADP